MEVICIEEKAFYALLDKVYAHIDNRYKERHNKWVSDEEAMKLLNITSKSTLQKFRNEGRIRYSQPEKKIIVYDVDSINDYLEKHAKEPF